MKKKMGNPSRHFNRTYESWEDDARSFRLTKKSNSDVFANLEVAQKMQMAPNVKTAPPPSVWKEFLTLGIRIVVIVLITTVILTFIYGIHLISDPGMTPAAQSGDIILIYRLDKNYNINDLVLLDFEGTRQIRRVIAQEGDVVDIIENGLVVNGVLQSDIHARGETTAFEEGIEFPITVPENEVFLLGDARELATDSRIYGTVRISDTHGRVITILRRRNL